MESIAGLVVLIGLATPGTGQADRRLDLGSFDRAWEIVRDRHFDARLGGLDWMAVREELRPQAEQCRSRGELRRVIVAMTERLGQSHFQVIPGEWLAVSKSAGGHSRLEGEVGFEVRLAAGEMVVTRVRRGSAADSAGVKAGLVVTAIGGERVSPWLERGLAELAPNSGRDGLLAAAAGERLEGRPGGKIAVTFRTGALEEETLVIQLGDKPGVRTDIGHLRGVLVTAERRWLDGGAGYIAFSSFIHPQYVMGEFNAAMEEFMDAPGIVIDLRGNRGGMIQLAAGMAGWFIADRTASLGEVRMRESKLKIAVQPRLRVYGGKVALLVDAATLSCAEAFAAGMRDNGRARIFGQRTAGAVLASALEMLPNGDALQYVYADYVSGGGRRLEGVGVQPDVVTPLIRTDLLNGRDVALEKALAWAR